MTLMISYLMWLETLDEDEREIFTRIFIEFYPKIKRYVAGYLTQSDVAVEDIVSATFERVMKYKEKFLDADDREIMRLLIIYARSIFFDENRRKKRIGFESYDEPNDDDGERTVEYEDENINVVEEVIKKETASVLRSRVKELGEPAASIIYLKYYAEHSSSEIANILNMNASTVRTILQKSREKLKSEMEEYFHDNENGSSI